MKLATCFNLKIFWIEFVTICWLYFTHFFFILHNTFWTICKAYITFLCFKYKKGNKKACMYTINVIKYLQGAYCNKICYATLSIKIFFVQLERQTYILKELECVYTFFALLLKKDHFSKNGCFSGISYSRHYKPRI